MGAAIPSLAHWVIILPAAIGVFVLLETALRWLVGIGLETDFYGSILGSTRRADRSSPAR